MHDAGMVAYLHTGDATIHEGHALGHYVWLELRGEGVSTMIGAEHTATYTFEYKKRMGERRRREIVYTYIYLGG